MKDSSMSADIAEVAMNLFEILKNFIILLRGTTRTVQ